MLTNNSLSFKILLHNEILEIIMSQLDTSLLRAVICGLSVSALNRQSQRRMIYAFTRQKLKHSKQRV